MADILHISSEILVRSRKGSKWVPIAVLRHVRRSSSELVASTIQRMVASQLISMPQRICTYYCQSACIGTNKCYVDASLPGTWTRYCLLSPFSLKRTSQRVKPLRERAILILPFQVTWRGVSVAGRTIVHIPCGLRSLCCQHGPPLNRLPCSHASGSIPHLDSHLKLSCVRSRRTRFLLKGPFPSSRIHKWIPSLRFVEVACLVSLHNTPSRFPRFHLASTRLTLLHSFLF